MGQFEQEAAVKNLIIINWEKGACHEYRFVVF